MKQTFNFEVEIERVSGGVDHTNAALPSMHMGQRLHLPIDGMSVHAEIIKVTKLGSGRSIKWKLLAREVAPAPNERVP
jgi:hypothetical protein